MTCAAAGAVGIKEQTMRTTIPSFVGFAEDPWNNGRLIGQKRPLKPKEVWAIRVRLQLEHCRRDLALFDLAVDQQAARLRPRAAPGEGRMCRGSDTGPYYRDPAENGQACPIRDHRADPGGDPATG